MSLLSKSTCISLGLLEEGWPHLRLQAAALSTAPHPPLGATPAPSSTAAEPDFEVTILKASIMAEFPTVFEDAPFRSMTGPPMHIDLRDDAVPCRHYRACTIPFQWRTAVEAQLASMVTKGVIEKVAVGESFTWCHPMVVVPKKSSEPRITVNLTSLNKYVQLPTYPTRVPSEVVASIPPGMRYFTTLDSRHGYWQVPLDEESSKLTTFITPWGAYRFRRNVTGLISAGDEHNRRGDEVLAGVDNVRKVVEDVLIYDADWATHVQRVRDVLRRCAENGISLHPGKFVFGAPTVSYCGFRLSGSGYAVDDHLVKALTHFPVPVNRTDIRSFCGLVQQFQSFSPRLTELLAPIRALLSPKYEFTWEAPHQEASEQVTRELASPRVLANFMPSRPCAWKPMPHSRKVSKWPCGSSNHPVTGAFYNAAPATLPQQNRDTPRQKWNSWPLCGPPKKPTSTSHAGSDFELLVDHRPLIPLLNSKTLDEMPSPRLTRLREKLALYRFTAVWCPGVEHKVVDCFSRHPVDDPSPDDSQEDDEAAAYVRAMLLRAHTDGATGDHILPLLDPHLTRLRTEANSDDKYKRLWTTVQQGFPTNMRQLDAATAPFYGLRQDLWVTDDLVMYGSRVIILESLRREVLHGLHAFYQGQDRTLRRARQVVYCTAISS